MLWVFLILGLLTLMAVLHGLVMAWLHQGRMLKLHLLALVLLGIAWSEEHTTIAGWVGLAASTVVELTTWSVWLFLQKGPQRLVQVIVPRIGAPTTKVSGTLTSERPEEAAGSVAPGPLGDAAAKAPAESDSRIADGTALQHCDTDFQPVRSPGDDAPPEDLEPPGDQAAGMTADATAGEGPSTSSLVEADAADVATDSHRLETGATASEVGATGMETDAETATWSLRTIVLFKRKYVVAAGVFLASLRRNGQRDATLAQTPGADDAAWIHAGPIAIELRSRAEPCDANTLNEVLAISPDGPESARLVVGHEAHATLTSVYPPETAPDLVVRLHHRAHAALMEFAPVVAIVWPDAGRVVPAEHLPALLDQAADPDRPMAETCTQIRVFPLSEPNSGWVLMDSVGLHALGLPDIQIITAAEPDEAIVQSLHDLTERFLTGGCDLSDGETFAMGDGPPGQVSYTRGAFQPDREVIQIAVKKE